VITILKPVISQHLGKRWNPCWWKIWYIETLLWPMQWGERHVTILSAPDKFSIVVGDMRSRVISSRSPHKLYVWRQLYGSRSFILQLGGKNQQRLHSINDASLH